MPADVSGLINLLAGQRRQRPPVVTLDNEMRGFWVPGSEKMLPGSPKDKPASLFIQLDGQGQELGSYYFGKGQPFTDVTKPPHLDKFLEDPDTWDPANPSNFEKQHFDLFQSFGGNKAGLKEYFSENPEFKIFKQESVPRRK